jgi:hypothetical protein
MAIALIATTRDCYTFVTDETIIDPAVEALSTQVEAVNTQEPENENNQLKLSLIFTPAASFFAGCIAWKQTTPNRCSPGLASVCALRRLQSKGNLRRALNNKIERLVKGKVFYVFKDEKAGVAYVGGEPEHRRYQQLSCSGTSRRQRKRR